VSRHNWRRLESSIVCGFDALQGEAVLHAFGAPHPPQGVPDPLLPLVFQAPRQLLSRKFMRPVYSCGSSPKAASAP